MGKRIEDLKETAPCGMLIHYTVNEEDMITYNDINGRGVHCDKCDGCTWKGICKPEEPKKAMSHKTYIEIYNLIDDAMQEAGEKVEEACNKLAKSDADPKCVLACNMVEQIKKYQKRCEIFAEHVEGEEQFELYKDRRNRMKKVGNNGEDTDYWWCDSPHASNTTYFCRVSANGGANHGYASTALAVPLCFEI